MGEQWQSGHRVVKILWTEDRAPGHSLDLPSGPICVDPDDYIGREDIPITREQALMVASDLNQETLDTWMERSWHAVFEVSEPDQHYGQIQDNGKGDYREDWTIIRAVSLVAPTAEEISALCASES